MKKKPISSEQAAQLEEATIKNIVDKVGAGGIPTARELDMLKAATAEPPAPAMTLKTATNSQLAKHYQVSVSTIKSWLKRHGSATVRDPAKLQHALDGQRSGKDIEPGTPLGKARLAKLEAETLRIRHLHEVEKGLWTRNDEVTRIASAWAAQVRAELMAMIPHLPTLAGLDPAALEDRAKQFVHGALSRLQTFEA
jgi:transposase